MPENSSNSVLIKSASYSALITTAIVLCFKAYGWLVTDSQSILSSLVDSMLDISSSFINLIAVYVALQPPDYNHRFGHEKFQDLAIFSQSIFFIASSLFIITSASRVIFYGVGLSNPELGLQAMYVSAIITFVLVCYQSYVLKKTASQIIAVDRLHYVSDFLTNITVIVSIHLSSKYWLIDPLAGIGISLYVIYAAWKLFRKAIRNLADEEFSDTDRQKILTVLSNYKQKYVQIKGVHELKTRRAANKAFIQFHLEMEGGMLLYDAHAISDEIMEALKLVFPGAEIIIHEDPAHQMGEFRYREHIH